MSHAEQWITDQICRPKAGRILVFPLLTCMNLKIPIRDSSQDWTRHTNSNHVTSDALAWRWILVERREYRKCNKLTSQYVQEKEIRNKAVGFWISTLHYPISPYHELV